LKGIWRGVVLCWAFLAVVLLPLSQWEGAALPAAGGAQLTIEEPAEGERALVALTFDDGPRRSTTEELLDGLAERGVRGTFFVIGSQVEGSEDLILRMDEEGHQLGIHTYDHVALTALSAADLAAQVDRTREALRGVLGHNGFLLRPPYGMTDAAARSRAGCPIILWSVDPKDWEDRDRARIVDAVVNEAQDGDIILLHDIYESSVEAALEIVDALHARGFLFVTVDELAQAKHVELEAGEVYRCFRD